MPGLTLERRVLSFMYISQRLNKTNSHNICKLKTLSELCNLRKIFCFLKIIANNKLLKTWTPKETHSRQYVYKVPGISTKYLLLLILLGNSGCNVPTSQMVTELQRVNRFNL